MRICVVGESPHSPTGFGTQAKYLGEAFERWGNEVYYLCGTSNTLQETPPLARNEWRIDSLPEPVLLDYNLSRIEPDAVIFFRDTTLLLKARECQSFYQNCPVFFWLAEEGTAHTEDFKYQFRAFPKGSLIPLTRATHDRIPNCGRVIPHGLPTSLFQDLPSKAFLRSKYSQRFGSNLDGPLMVAVNRNCTWKCWDATFDVLSKVPGKLLVHTRTKQTKGSFYDFSVMEELFGVKGRVIYSTGKLEHREIIELYTMADLSISTSAGEGFGMSAVESILAGTPQIANSYPAAEEILPPEYLVPPSGRIMMGDRLWSYPDVNAIAERVKNFIQNGPPNAPESHRMALKRFDIDEVALDFLSEIDDSRGNLSRRRAYRWGLDLGGRPAQELALVVAALKMGKTAFHLKCWEGGFVHRFLQTGNVAYGIEDEVGVFPDQTRGFCKQASLLERWSPADVLVATDVFDHIHRRYQGKMWELIDRFKDYKVLFLRFRPDYLWGQRVADREGIKTYLNSKGLVRRNDLEDVIKKMDQLADFDHEIWAMGGLSI